MKSQHTSVERKALIRERYQARTPWRNMPERLATVDELPKADISDFKRAYKEQREFDSEESQY